MATTRATPPPRRQFLSPQRLLPQPPTTTQPPNHHHGHHYDHDLPEPPHLEVLDPVYDATVTTARYTFSGVTDPGCTVTVGGRYEGTVEEDGSWILEVKPEPGRNSTTFIASDRETGLETSEAIRVDYAEAVELLADGLGAVSFGQDETTTLAILTGLFGPPATETLCADEVLCRDMGYGLVPPHVNSEPTCRNRNLSILTADCEGPTPSRRRHRHPDRLGRSGDRRRLRTPEGVGAGAHPG